MATFFAVTTSPSDNGALDDTVAREIAPPSGMQVGDLVIVTVGDRSGTEVMSVDTTGGQSWTTESPQDDGSPAMGVFWCRFNGTWTTNPKFIATGKFGSAFILVMTVYRPSVSSNTWSTDVAQTEGNTANPLPSPYDATVPSRTVSANSVTQVVWGVGAARVFALQTAGWSNPGGLTQIRNTTGSDATLSIAYRIMSTAGATGAVTNRQTTSGIVAQWLIQTWKEVAAAGPAITDVDTDEIVTATQTNVVITGSGFGSTQGTGVIRSRISGITSNWSVDSWSATSIQADVVQGNCPYGTGTLEVVTNAGQLASIPITINPPSGRTVVTLSSLVANEFNSRQTPLRPYSSPDLTLGSQLEYGITSGSGSLTIAATGGITADLTVLQFTWRWHNGSTWSSLYTWDLRGYAPDRTSTLANDLGLTTGVAMTTQQLAPFWTDLDSSAAQLSYSLTPAVPGLFVSSSTGAVTGTPTTPGTTAVTARVTDEGGLNGADVTFNVRVSNAPIPPVFSGTYADVAATTDVAITPINAATGWSGQDTFDALTVLPAAPGLSISSPAGVITGVVAVAGDYTITVTARNAAGTASKSFLMKVEEQTTGDNVVPDLIGLNVTDATFKATQAQFTFGSTTAGLNVAAFGIIYAQFPEANSTAALGTSIDVLVSVGVPDSTKTQGLIGNINYSLPANADGTFDYAYPAGDKP